MDFGFYSSDDTDLTNLLTRIETTSGDAVSIIISDLVESTTRREPERLIATLRDLAEKNPGSALLAFRSSFKGTYWIESDPLRRGQEIQLNLDDGREDQGRPFYLVVFAPSEEALEGVQRRLLEGLGAAETLHASAPALEVYDVSYAPSAGNDVVWNLWSPPTTVGTSYVGFFFERQPPRAEAGALRLRLGTRTNVPLNSPDRVRMYVDGVRDVTTGEAQQLDGVTSAEHVKASDNPISNNPGTEERIRLPAAMADSFHCTFAEWIAAPSPSSEETSAAPGEEAPAPPSETYELTCPLPRPAPYTWDAYRISVTPGEGNLQVPVWVEQWSTGDDTRYDQSNRTLDLADFVLAMLSAVTENTVFHDQIVIVGRGE